MTDTPKPPPAYERFVARHPLLEEAWQKINDAGASGPLDAETMRLIKLGIAIGAGREGAVRAGARKARAMGISEDSLQQVVSLAAGTIGLPATVAAFCWITDGAKHG